MDHIGIDVHKRESQIYILAEGGEVIEQRIRTEPERFDAVLGSRPRARIVIEASTDSEWVARCLEALGHEVIVADPNFAPMYATRTRKVKTDRRDARALAEACLLGAYRPAHRLSDPQRHVRGRLGVRDALVHTRTRYISVIRALLRQHGYRVPSGSAGGFIERVQRLPLPGRLRSVVAPLLAVMRPLNQQLAYSDATIEHLAVQDPRVPRLRSVPSIGPVTAAAFLAAIDDARASPTPISSRPTSASCPASTAPATRSAAAPSPRRATRACAGCSSKPRSRSCAAGRPRPRPSGPGPCASPPAAASTSPSSRSPAAWPAFSMRSSGMARCIRPAPRRRPFHTLSRRFTREHHVGWDWTDWTGAGLNWISGLNVTVE